MKLLIDFSPIKSGGGAQLAINFLKLFKADCNFDVLISDAFPYNLNELNLQCNVIVNSAKTISRLKFEYFHYKKIVKKNNYTHVYTFFGSGLPKIKGVKQISGVAYPIICNDDSPYWKFLPTTFKFKKKIVNYIRKSRLKTADHIIFETEVMQSRCCDVLNFNATNSTVLAPTPSFFIKKAKVSESRNITKFLILSGLDYHKNIWRVVQLLPKLRENNIIVKFVLSSTKNQLVSFYRNLIDGISEELIDEFFEFKGHIKADLIQQVYDDIDVVMNIADLESFSNNYMEAWVAGKPILASDRDFARYICKGSAYYVEPHDSKSLYNGMVKFVNKEIDKDEMVMQGEANLSILPSFEERVEKILEVIKR
ncbi:glycosyltransferase [Pseudoalteromonas sp. MMG005]|uniref:glycosyltransferase n=1 Tax=Pseudoalteromonas sp. MMG005 TaxID=2822682 RepID=UPI001B3A378C|nr:glycosyltransferase [Pseudoalteromonas sp. MMG005]MBQ4844381.1 glycosyltransferase [Pseudoalteromonas sp. MMG005]